MDPYTKDYQNIVFEPFIDYETGEVKEGSPHFKPLSRAILQYIEYAKNKFVSDVGVLERKQAQVDGWFTLETEKIILKVRFWM